MCLIAFALDAHPDYRLVLVANRDEFYERPTQAMHWWSETGPLAGRDQRSGGTWLALSPQGRLSALTNFRSGLQDPSRRSRGELPLRALEADDAGEQMQRILSERQQYAPFNLICYDQGQMQVIGSEEPNQRHSLQQGVHGLSNHLLDTPWPKVQRGCHALEQLLQQPQIRHEQLIQSLHDREPAPDEALPDTGVGLSFERFFSPPFVHGGIYGTRATTAVTIRRDGYIEVTEQQYDTQARATEQRNFHWQPR